MESLLSVLVGMVPVTYWPLIGKWSVGAILLVIVVDVLALLVERIDLSDGKRDWPVVGSVVYALAQILTVVQALARVLPFKLPFIGALAKLDEIRAPHTDDGSQR